MSDQPDIYDFPKYYDLVYGSDWKAEFDFLSACFESYVDGTVESLFEPACGTGRLLYRFGKAGYAVSGNDLNEKSIVYCNRRLVRHGLPPSTFVADMCDFSVKNPVDAAFNMINSFRHLIEQDQATSHLQCMAKALRPGGIYVLGLHLTPTKGDPVSDESWSASRGHLTINSSMWLVDRNLAKRYEDYGMAYDVYTPTGHQRMEDVIRFRTWTARQFISLVESVDGLDICAIHDFSYDIDDTIDLDPTVEDCVFILRRKS